MKYITVYPTKKLAESHEMLSISNGIDIQPNETGLIEIPIKTPTVEKNIEFFVDKGFLTYDAPKEEKTIQPLTKKELIKKADDLGLKWDKKQQKMKNENMEVLIAEAEAKPKETVDDTEIGKEDETTEQVDEEQDK